MRRWVGQHRGGYDHVIRPVALRQSLCDCYIREWSGNDFAFTANHVPDLVAKLRVNVAHDLRPFRFLREKGFAFFRFLDRIVDSAGASFVSGRNLLISAEPP